MITVRSTSRRSPARPAQQPRTPAASRLCAVRLVDLRTGDTHRINGNPLLVVTRDPVAAAEDLLEGRDRSLWQVQVEPVGQGGRA